MKNILCMLLASLLLLTVCSTAGCVINTSDIESFLNTEVAISLDSIFGERNPIVGTWTTDILVGEYSKLTFNSDGTGKLFYHSSYYNLKLGDTTSHITWVQTGDSTYAIYIDGITSEPTSVTIIDDNKLDAGRNSFGKVVYFYR